MSRIRKERNVKMDAECQSKWEIKYKNEREGMSRSRRNQDKAGLTAQARYFLTRHSSLERYIWTSKKMIRIPSVFGCRPHADRNIFQGQCQSLLLDRCVVARLCGYALNTRPSPSSYPIEAQWG